MCHFRMGATPFNLILHKEENEFPGDVMAFRMGLPLGTMWHSPQSQVCTHVPGADLGVTLWDSCSPFWKAHQWWDAEWLGLLEGCVTEGITGRSCVLLPPCGSGPLGFHRCGCIKRLILNQGTPGVCTLAPTVIKTAFIFIFGYIPNTYSTYLFLKVKKWPGIKVRDCNFPMPGIFWNNHPCTCSNLLLVYWAMHDFFFFKFTYPCICKTVILLNKLDRIGQACFHFMCFFCAWSNLYWLSAYLDMVWQGTCYGGEKMNIAAMKYTKYDIPERLVKYWMLYNTVCPFGK